MQETWVQFWGDKNPLEKEMATQSSILAWRIQQTEEPGGLQVHGVTRVGHDLETKQKQYNVKCFAIHCQCNGHELGQTFRDVEG